MTFQSSLRSSIKAAVVLLVVLSAFGHSPFSSATPVKPNTNRKVTPNRERSQADSVLESLVNTEIGVSSSLSKNQPVDHQTVDKDPEHQQVDATPPVPLCPNGNPCSSTGKFSPKKKTGQTVKNSQESAPNKQLRKILSDEEIVELLSDPHLEISPPQQLQQYPNNDNNAQPWIFGSSQRRFYEKYMSNPSQNAQYNSQFQTGEAQPGTHRVRQQRTLRSTADGSGLGSDYGQMAAGGTDVVVNLLAEVSGLQNMVKELVGALQGNMQGVGTEFTNVHKQAFDLQSKFQSAFSDLNSTVRGIYSQVSTDVSGLRADVYRLHASLQGTTPTGQRLIVQPDRIDPSRPKAIGVDCASLYRAGARESGVYMLQPDPADNTTKMAAYCDMKTAGGGWTVIQRRMDGSEDFFRSWRSYKMGFGSLLHDYWLGLDSIHRLTQFGNTHLRIELKDWENQTRVAEFRYVRVMDESDGYRILAGSASGDAGDPFHSVAYTSRLQSMRFSTFDLDNDMNTGTNCAKTFTSGWWFNSCFSVNLNGVWYGSPSYVGPSMNGVIWDLWDHHSKGYSLKATEIKLRTEDF